MDLKLLVVVALVAFIPQIQCQTSNLPKIARRGTVRFVRGTLTSPVYTSGRVHVYLNNRWGTICDDFHFTSTEATVICHQMGYTGASTYSRRALDSFGIVKSTFTYAMDNVDCSTSSYLVILQCRYSTLISSGCTHNLDEVSVTCFTTRIWNSPYDGQIRILGAQYTNQGRVEVYCNGQWGTICDDGFGQTDANTVCRQQGYTRAAEYDDLTSITGTNQPIWLSNIFCSSSYSCLRSCQRCPSVAVSNCGHHEDITVQCEYASGQSSSTRTSTCSFTTINTSTPITGIIVGVIIASLVCIFLPIIIPVCICCCLGIGVCGASRNRGPSSRVVTTAAPPPATAVVTTTQTSQKVDYPTGAYSTNSYPAQPPPPAYAAQPPAGYPANSPAAYPANPPAAYPANPPAAYPANPPATYPANPPAAYY